jgi:2-oxoglutarate ferredoxin oxidoreductase subunit alpha
LTGAKGRKQNIVRSFYNETGVLEVVNKRIQKNLRRIEKSEGRVETFMMDDAEWMLAAFGTCARLCREVVKQCRKDGIAAGLLRPISLWPFPTKTIEEHLDHLKGGLVVEMNAGQMVEDVRLAANGRIPVGFIGRMGGGVPTTTAIRAKLDEMR